MIPHHDYLVWWQEYNDIGEVERKEGVFTSEEEMTDFLSSRLATGRVVVDGMLSSVESIWYEVIGEMPEIKETPENGFYLPKERKTSRPASREKEEEE